MEKEDFLTKKEYKVTFNELNSAAIGGGYVNLTVDGNHTYKGYIEEVLHIIEENNIPYVVLNIESCSDGAPLGLKSKCHISYDNIKNTEDINN